MYEKRVKLSHVQLASVALDVALGMVYLHHQVLAPRQPHPESESLAR